MMEKVIIRKKCRKQLSGQKFGRLTALIRFRRKNCKSDNIWFYHCVCECGKLVNISRNNLVTGTSKSCGCYKLYIQHKRKAPSYLIKLHGIIRYYKRNAKVGGRVWELSQEYAEALVQKPCIYCGYDKDYVGIDRKNSLKGYTKDNVVPCCRWCNWAKMNRSVKDFKKWVKEIYNHIYGEHLSS